MACGLRLSGVWRRG